MTDYPDTKLFIGGKWRQGAHHRTLAVFNPASGEPIGRVACASTADLDDALEAAQHGFDVWRATPALERTRMLRAAADLIRERSEHIATLMTLEQGKPLAESRAETLGAADCADWFAGEAQRTYGRVIPARSQQVTQFVTCEPVGPVAAFAPWNFPINQLIRKVLAALATGCSIIAKGPEEAPASPAAIVETFVDAGVPPEVINLVFGDPAEISSYLVPHPTIKKISFTGSTSVGKQLAALAGRHMKRATMELGGHAPVIIADDADVDLAVTVMVASKFRNAGQVCVAPTRFVIHESRYEEFLQKFATAADAIVVGDGLNEDSGMGPLAHSRRIAATDEFVQDAIACGAELVSGGTRLGTAGYFYRPTVLSRVPVEARAMNEEPFGPIALLMPYSSVDDAIFEANRLPYGLAAYAFTRSSAVAHRISSQVRSGMISINHAGLALPETPNGGVGDSGFGSEGGSEALEPYLVTKFVTTRHDL